MYFTRILYWHSRIDALGARETPIRICARSHTARESFCWTCRHAGLLSLPFLHHAAGKRRAAPLRVSLSPPGRPSLSAGKFANLILGMYDRSTKSHTSLRVYASAPQRDLVLCDILERAPRRENNAGCLGNDGRCACFHYLTTGDHNSSNHKKQLLLQQYKIFSFSNLAASKAQPTLFWEQCRFTPALLESCPSVACRRRCDFVILCPIKHGSAADAQQQYTHRPVSERGSLRQRWAGT